MQSDKVVRDMFKFLNQDILKSQLIIASLYLSAYEMLIHSVVERIKEFYIRGFDGEKYIYGEDYKNDVKSLYKQDIVVASSLWLRDNGAITDDDVENIKAFKLHRNDIAHELPKYLLDSDFNVEFSYFGEMEALYKKICMWWFKEVEVSVNPEFDTVDLETLDYDMAISTAIFPMTHLVNIAQNEFTNTKAQ
jgi:hypothetical protein